MSEISMLLFANNSFEQYQHPETNVLCILIYLLSVSVCVLLKGTSFFMC